MTYRKTAAKETRVKCVVDMTVLTVDIQLVINFYDTKFSCKRYRKLDRLE